MRRHVCVLVMLIVAIATVVTAGRDVVRAPADEQEEHHTVVIQDERLLSMLRELKDELDADQALVQRKKASSSTTTNKPPTTTKATTTTKAATTTKATTTRPTTTDRPRTTTRSKSHRDFNDDQGAVASCSGPVVAFTAIRTRDFDEGVHDLVYDHILADLGGGFDNPEFRAPYTGVYNFNINFSYGSVKKDMLLHLMVDNKITFERHLDKNCNCNSEVMDFSLNLFLEKDQAVWVQIDSKGKLEGQNHIFSGRLLQAQPE